MRNLVVGMREDFGGIIKPMRPVTALNTYPMPLRQTVKPAAKSADFVQFGAWVPKAEELEERKNFYNDTTPLLEFKPDARLDLKVAKRAIIDIIYSLDTGWEAEKSLPDDWIPKDTQDSIKNWVQDDSSTVLTKGQVRTWAHKAQYKNEDLAYANKHWVNKITQGLIKRIQEKYSNIWQVIKEEKEEDPYVAKDKQPPSVASIVLPKLAGFFAIPVLFVAIGFMLFSGRGNKETVSGEMQTEVVADVAKKHTVKKGEWLLKICGEQFDIDTEKHAEQIGKFNDRFTLMPGDTVSFLSETHKLTITGVNGKEKGSEILEENN